MASVHFRDVSNEELINNTRALVRSATTLEVKLLYHLDEIRSRGIENCIKPSALLSVLQKKRRRLINERFKSQRIAAQQSRTSAAARQARMRALPSLLLWTKSPAARKAASWRVMYPNISHMHFGTGRRAAARTLAAQQRTICRSITNKLLAAVVGME